MLDKISSRDFTSDQREAVDRIVEWYKNSSKQEFRLAGYAGTGKSSLISLLPSLLHKAVNKYVPIKYGAYTGKAAKVLNNKNIPATTIHSMIYDANVRLNEETGLLEHHYTLKQNIGAELIIIDEASMVSHEIYKDLKSFKKKILFVGDSGQLPPIDSELNLMDEKEIDFTLQKIHRQAEGSNIIRLSVAIRHGDNIVDHQTDSTAKMRFNQFDQQNYLNFDQLITGKNVDRVAYNRLIRKMRGFEDDNCPQPGDKMIFLRNNKNCGVLNGQQIVITGVKNVKNGYFIHYVDLDNTKGGEACNEIWYKCINNPEPTSRIKFEKGEYSPNLLQCDFAYCVSCHKYQGSQANSILLLDDKFGSWDADLRRRWLYTAVTRAQEKLVWLY